MHNFTYLLKYEKEYVTLTYDYFPDATAIAEKVTVNCSLLALKGNDRILHYPEPQLNEIKFRFPLEIQWEMKLSLV